ncbi:hypothetical protein IV64_GL000135 [Lactiplantibacillus xiangfangensis]|uniref:Uncharacterized protein n=1 Tax=Lactiplantibacillus xiangfangensis TaxID=942150 RepID=A0A0R2MAM7_9LACO|nr:hypothetical protein IV64_GL000135 [Lactiplantibacillus xiangfangensis]
MKVKIDVIKQESCDTSYHGFLFDLPRLQKMLDHADVLWTAWDGPILVGFKQKMQHRNFEISVLHFYHLNLIFK